MLNKKTYKKKLVKLKNLKNSEKKLGNTRLTLGSNWLNWFSIGWSIWARFCWLDQRPRQYRLEILMGKCFAIYFVNKFSIWRQKAQLEYIFVIFCLFFCTSPSSQLFLGTHKALKMAKLTGLYFSLLFSFPLIFLEKGLMLVFSLLVELGHWLGKSSFVL